MTIAIVAYGLAGAFRARATSVAVTIKPVMDAECHAGPLDGEWRTIDEIPEWGQVYLLSYRVLDPDTGLCRYIAMVRYRYLDGRLRYLPPIQ